MLRHAKDYLDIFVRYLILVAVAIPGLYIFYLVFKPLTIYPVYFVIHLFHESTLIEHIIFVGNILSDSVIPIEIIDACVAGSAYYLLLILNLSTPRLKIGRRLKMLGISLFLFLLLNILRILILSFLAISGSSFFDITHLVFWYGFSIVFVVGIWFLQVKWFKIKPLPFYSDLKFLFGNINSKS